MIKPKAPSWFAKKLREMDPTLGVAWTAPSEWTVYQHLPIWVPQGSWEGNKLFSLERVPHRVTSFKQIGSKILVELRKLWSGNYRNFEEFGRENNVPTDFTKDEKELRDLQREYFEREYYQAGRA